MVFKISTRDKQEFLKWFLKSHEFSTRENKWILEMLLKQPEVLDQVNFVKSIEGCPRSISMSTICSDKTDFIFKKNKLITIDQHKAYHDLRLNTKVPIYIKLNYKNQDKCPKYGFVAIDNPYEKNDFLIGKNKYLVDKDLDEMAFNKTIELLNDNINKAIDNHDEKSFYYYSKRLQEIESQVKNEKNL